MHLGIAKTPFLHFYLTTKSSNGRWCIGKAMERRAEQVKFTGRLATPGSNVD